MWHDSILVSKIRSLQQSQCDSKVPWRGLDKANLWLDLRIAALNLDRAGRLGIIR